MIEILFVVVGIALVVGELYVWHAGVLWHDGPKEDPRNFPPS